MEQVRTQIRFPEETYAKARVLAAIHDVSFNQYLVDALNEKIAQWESGHGELPTLREAEKSERR